MSKQTERDEEDERDRRVTNIFLLVLFVVVIGIGVWLVDALIEYRNLDNCIAQGRRDCGNFDVPSR
jgi:hypothetical protein